MDIGSHVAEKASRDGLDKRISWSKTGLIAYAAAKLNLTFLECIDGRSWQLSAPQEITLEKSWGAVSLLSWSSLSTDLAICDIFGNVSVLLSGLRKDESHGFSRACFNKMAVTFTDQVSERKADSEVIELKWLNMNKNTIAYVPAVRHDSGVSYSFKQFQPSGVCHPIISKQAFVALRRNGELCLFYQGEHGTEYHVSKCDLPNCSNVELASIGFTADHKIAVAISNSSLLRIYTCEIDWGYLVNSAQQQLRNPTFVTNASAKRPEPSLNVSCIAASDFCSFGQGSLKKLLVVSPNLTLPDSNHLEVILLIDKDQHSSAVRYKLKEEPSRLHHEFNHKENQSLHRDLVLVQQQPFDDIVLDFSLCASETSIFTRFLSGKVAVFNRNFKSSEETFSQLTDVGFAFPPVENHPLVVCPSPNVSAAVCMHYKSESLTLHCIEHTRMTKMEVPGLTYRHSVSCFANASTDDIAMTMISFLEQNEEKRSDLIFAILRECYKSVNFSLNVPKELVEKVTLHPVLHKMLGLQLSLSTRHNWTKEKSGIMAHSILNLRLVAFASNMTIKSFQLQSQRLMKKQASNVPETLADFKFKAQTMSSILGVAEYLSDFIVFLNQEMMLDSYQTGVALPLLFAKVPSSFLAYSLGELRKISNFTKNSASRQNGVNVFRKVMADSFERFDSIFTSSPVPLPQFEKFLDSLGALLASVPLDKAQAAAAEEELVFKGTVPGVFASLIPKVSELYNVHMAGIDESRVFFHNVEWLRIYKNPRSQPVDLPVVLKQNNFDWNKELLIQGFAESNGQVIDSLCKNVMFEEYFKSLRSCVRCGLISSALSCSQFEDIVNSSWPLFVQRTCLCGGFITERS